MENYYDILGLICFFSGIGPAEHLKDHDIKIMQDLPAVGSNLVRFIFFSAWFAILLTFLTARSSRRLHSVEYPNVRFLGISASQTMVVLYRSVSIFDLGNRSSSRPGIPAIPLSPYQDLRRERYARQSQQSILRAYSRR